MHVALRYPKAKSLMVNNENVVTSGGRVLGVTALGQGLQAARDLAYKAASKIHFKGAFTRTDIAAKAL